MPTTIDSFTVTYYTLNGHESKRKFRTGPDIDVSTCRLADELIERGALFEFTALAGDRLLVECLREGSGGELEVLGRWEGLNAEMRPAVESLVKRTHARVFEA